MEGYIELRTKIVGYEAVLDDNLHVHVDYWVERGAPLSRLQDTIVMERIFKDIYKNNDWKSEPIDITFLYVKKTD